MTPNSKPQASRQKVEVAALAAWKESGQQAQAFPTTYVFAVRGYYQDSMGKVGANDTGIYDDAVFIITPEHFSTWNANTDPSRYGLRPEGRKYLARLKPGVWSFTRLKHKITSPRGYMAFGQGSKAVTVERIKADGTVAQTESGHFGINLHRGGTAGTSSEGCQTIPPTQWGDFDTTLADIIGGNRFPYILTDQPIA